MATRLYLTNAAPSSTAPAVRGAWNVSTATLNRALGRTKSGAATTTAIAKGSTTAVRTVLAGRWVSEPIEVAGDLTGAMQWVMGVLESNANLNAYFYVHAWVTQGSTGNLRGTLLNGFIGGTEFTTTATGRGEGGEAISTVACQVGDRVVVEIGYRTASGTTGTNTYTGTFHYGGTGTTDLGQGGTSTSGPANRPGWVEFTDPNGVLKPAPTTGGGGGGDAEVVGASAGGQEFSTTANVPRPTGLADGDLVLALTFRDNTPSATVTPDGGTFTAVPGGDRETADALRLGVWTNPASSEPTSWGWTCSSNASWSVTAVGLRGVPADAEVQVFFAEGGSGTPVAPAVPGTSYTGDDPLVLTGYATVDDGNYDGVIWDTTKPTGMTVQLAHGTYGDGMGGGYLGTLVASRQDSGHPDIPATSPALSPSDGDGFDFQWVAVTVVIPTAAASVDPPTVDAGADAAVGVADTFTRTASETGDDIVERGWTIVDGPVGVGATIGTAAALSWVPGASLPGSNDVRQPTFEEIAYEITSTAENSRTDWYSTDVYGYIEDIGDERGYTAGIVGFCSGTGDMLEMVEHYVDLNPSTPLAAYVDELTTLAAEGQGPTAGSRADTLLGSTFRDLWASLAVSDPLFRQAQRDYRDEQYWEPALAQALDDGVGPLGLAILYDISINHGHADPGTAEYPEGFEGIVATAHAAAAPPVFGGNEADYLNALVDAREAVLISWGEDPGDLATGRVGAHRALITSGNLTLTAPIEWEMYTDPFELTTRPNPVDDVVAGIYTLRYSATNAGGTDTDDMILTVVTTATVDGTAELVGPALTLGASGLPTVTGTAELVGPGLALAASGTRTAPGTAALSGPALALTASGTPTVLGSAALTGPNLALAASGVRTTAGAAELLGPALSLAAAGSLATAGVAALPGPALALAAVAHPVGVAALLGPALELAAEGVRTTAGSATLTGPALALAASGLPTAHGSAELALGALVLVAEAHPVGVAGLPGPALALAAAGLPTVHGVATLVGPALDLAVEATGNRFGDAALPGPALSLAAAGLPTVLGAAALPGPALALMATGVRATAGTAALVGPGLALSAAGLRTVLGAAALDGPGLVLVADGLPTVHGAASLVGPALTLTVAGVRTTAGTAALVGPELVLETLGAGAPVVGGAANLPLGALALAASGVRTTAGAALLDGPPLALTAAGLPTVHGAAALELGALLLAASGTRTAPGSAQLQLAGLALSAAGLGATPGFGDALLQLAALVLHATGTRKPPQGSWGSLRSALEQPEQVPDRFCPDCGTELRRGRHGWRCPFDGYTTRALASTRPPRTRSRSSDRTHDLLAEWSRW